MFKLICMEKVNFITHLYLKILQRNSKRVVLGIWEMSGYADPKWYYQLIENNLDLCQHAKTHFIIHFFYEMLHFQESCNFISWQHFGPYLKNQNFAMYGKSLNNNISFHLHYFKDDQIWWPYFGVILSSFCPNLDINEFFGKKDSLSSI